MRICIASIVVSLLLTHSTLAQNKRDLAVRSDKQELANNETWVYDDLDAAIDEAKRSKRPLMIVFR